MLAALRLERKRSQGGRRKVHATAKSISGVGAERTDFAWLLELLDLPRGAMVGANPTAKSANLACLEFARSQVLKRLGKNGAAPHISTTPIRILVNQDATDTQNAALQDFDSQSARVTQIATDSQGRMIPTALKAELSASDVPAIVIAQAAQVQTAAVDPFKDISSICTESSAWLHVDGGFGLWARACSNRRHLLEGAEAADSWAVDLPDWRKSSRPRHFAIFREKFAFGFSLGRSDFGERTGARKPIRACNGEALDHLVSQSCRFARLTANRLRREPGILIRNNVSLNRVLFDFMTSEEHRTTAISDIISSIRDAGLPTVEPTLWRGRQCALLSLLCNDLDEFDVESAVRTISEAWRNSPAYPYRQQLA